MKMKIIIVGILLLSFLSIAYAEPIIDLKIIGYIESHNNPMAYNKHSEARGQYQITPICLKDYNQVKNTHWQPKDLFNPILNKIIANWYINERIPQFLSSYKKPITIENILICYNAGISWVITGGELPKETKNYIKKYKQLSKK